MSKSIAVETSQTEVCLSIDLFWQQTFGNPIELSLFMLLFSIVLSVFTSKNEWKCLFAQIIRLLMSVYLVAIQSIKKNEAKIVNNI